MVREFLSFPALFRVTFNGLFHYNAVYVARANFAGGLRVACRTSIEELFSRVTHKASHHILRRFFLYPCYDIRMQGQNRTLVARIISMAGSWWGILLSTFLVYLIYPIPDAKLMSLLVWVYVPTLFSEAIKFVFRRPRPAARGVITKVKAYGYSFPSSHTVAACMIVSWIFLVPEIHWWSYPFILWPVFVGWSRVWLRAHDTVDVVGGVVFGTVCTAVLYFI